MHSGFLVEETAQFRKTMQLIYVDVLFQIERLCSYVKKPCQTTVSGPVHLPSSLSSSFQWGQLTQKQMTLVLLAKQNKKAAERVGHLCNTMGPGILILP